MLAYTKGPWTLEEVGDKVKHLCPAKDGTSILTVAIEYDDDDDTQYFASVWSRDDAKLIGCAPELLEALIEHHSKVIHTMQIPNNCPTCALIAKATE